MKRVVASLGTAQTVAWASSYYLPAILADAIALELDTSANQIFAAFSMALLIAAVLGPRVGRAVDHFGGRAVLCLSNIVLAGGLGLLAIAPNTATLWCAWVVLGLGMGLGLYDTAFAALGRIYGANARRAITGITLIAGFASTIGWPLSAWCDSELGWRATCAAWALSHLLIGFPLNRFGLPSRGDAAPEHADADPRTIRFDRNMVVLCYCFSASWIVTAGMAAHLPRLLEAAGATTAEAIAAGALIGPAQVAGRFLEAGLMRRAHPLTSLRMCLLGHPIGAIVLALSMGKLPALFALLHGAGNGILTITRGTVPLAIFGPQNFGYRSGLLGAPARVCQAASPLAFGALVSTLGTATLGVSAALMLSAAASLWFLRLPRPGNDGA